MNGVVVKYAVVAADVVVVVAIVAVINGNISAIVAPTDKTATFVFQPLTVVLHWAVGFMGDVRRSSRRGTEILKTL